MEVTTGMNPSKVGGSEISAAKPVWRSGEAAFHEKLEMAVTVMEKTGKLDRIREVIEKRPVTPLVHSIMAGEFPDFLPPAEPEDFSAPAPVRAPETKLQSTNDILSAASNHSALADAVEGSRRVEGGFPHAPPTPFQELIEKAASAYGLDARLIEAVIRIESNFDNNAVSRAGAKGLMQLMPATAKSLNVQNPFDAEQNILAGSRYLKQLLDRYHGDLHLALAAYNWGSGNLSRFAHAIPEGTRIYIQKIMALIEPA